MGAAEDPRLISDRLAELARTLGLAAYLEDPHLAAASGARLPARREFASKLPFTGFGALLRAAAAGWRISEVDVDYRPRTGRSKVTGTLRGTMQTVRDMDRVLRS